MGIPTDMTAFVRAVERGGFSAAARELGLTPSAVSKLVTRMEDRLGVRLLNRTTRRLALTPEGEAYFHRAQRILADIEEAENEVARFRARPHGKLRINVGTAFGGYQFVPALPEFLARYPEIEVEITITDRVVDLMEEGADVGIRTGELHDSSLVARRICDMERVICAAPAYLRRHGTPRTPGDLAKHNCLVLAGTPQFHLWPFDSPEGVRSVEVGGNVTASNAETLVQLAAMGLGSSGSRRDRGRRDREGTAAAGARGRAPRGAPAAACGLPPCAAIARPAWPRWWTSSSRSSQARPGACARHSVEPPRARCRLRRPRDHRHLRHGRPGDGGRDRARGRGRAGGGVVHARRPGALHPAGHPGPHGHHQRDGEGRAHLFGHPPRSARRLEGHLFVAHNARFDYGFLKNEFARLETAFTAEVLCTVRLSRRLYPEAVGHGLDALINRHGLVDPLDAVDPSGGREGTRRWGTRARSGASRR